MIKDENKEQEVTPEAPSSEDQRVEDALAAVNEIKDSLTSNLADVTAENESLHAEADESDAKLSAQDEKIKELEKTLEEAQSAREEAEKRLQDIERSRLVANRARTLKDGGIARSREDEFVKQVEKCADMSEEEFEAYTADLLDVRNTVLAQFQAAEEKAEEAEKEEELSAEVEEIKAADEETAASVDEIDEKLRKVLSDEGFLGSPETPEQTSAEESEEEEASTEEETSEDSEEAAAKESASVNTETYTKALLACFE